MDDTYEKREQTGAKHFILRRYLQALAFKVLHKWDAITYVDGFSGPWESVKDDYSDTSFMIAIHALKDAQKRIEADTGRRVKVTCFFSENDRAKYAKLVEAVAKHHQPGERFEIVTKLGDFEDAVSEIRGAIGKAFPLIFIDPTGWTGYPFEKIKAIFDYPRCEVLINFMYDFVNRAAGMSDPKTIASLDPILGGPGWVERLDPNLPRGLAVEKRFRDTLKAVGNFAYVVSTKVDRSTTDRPHFFIAYGTKSREGLKAFRETEYEALRVHAQNRGAAKERKREEKTGSADLFSGMLGEVEESDLETVVAGQKRLASDYVTKLIGAGPQKFASLVDAVLQTFMLRETNLKDICVDLARSGIIKNTWGNGNHKPKDECSIELAPAKA